MERLDAIVASTGILVVAVALGGVATSDAPPAVRTFTVAFAEQRAALPVVQGGVAGDGSAALNFSVPQRNVTHVDLTVRASGAGPRAFANTVTVLVEDPARRSTSQTQTLPGPGGAQELTFTFSMDLNALPQTQSVRAANEAGALAAAGQGTTNGTGNWTVTVRFQSTGPGQLASEGHTVSLEGQVAAYRAAVQPEAVPAR